MQKILAGVVAADAGEINELAALCDDEYCKEAGLGVMAKDRRWKKALEAPFWAGKQEEDEVAGSSTGPALVACCNTG